ncbi:hypothetical protein BABINDRAFT_168524 [Babjeviella inositovora NRRL Y-12698]|uniref:Uncharacterized protein n=1 Tax=Babjeviella inositovora NRRL Y-12698 TaxID=984486 RepID=A0A1E3QJR9_9ASCO|nr:uncharacterized protein BABINDRAFT_168524 [Babjeviella inositovora NRRL Y-12698]ODQ77936.1 hypothetical protein BABINDRAFT_168524 [Babjeviella inositovora NRRL Y-12698]
MTEPALFTSAKKESLLLHENATFSSQIEAKLPLGTVCTSDELNALNCSSSSPYDRTMDSGHEQVADLQNVTSVSAKDAVLSPASRYSDPTLEAETPDFGVCQITCISLSSIDMGVPSPSLENIQSLDSVEMGGAFIAERKSPREKAERGQSTERNNGIPEKQERLFGEQARIIEATKNSSTLQGAKSYVGEMVEAEHTIMSPRPAKLEPYTKGPENKFNSHQTGGLLMVEQECGISPNQREPIPSSKFSKEPAAHREASARNGIQAYSSTFPRRAFSYLPTPNYLTGSKSRHSEVQQCSPGSPSHLPSAQIGSRRLVSLGSRGSLLSMEALGAFNAPKSDLDTEMEEAVNDRPKKTHVEREKQELAESDNARVETAPMLMEINRQYELDTISDDEDDFDYFRTFSQNLASSFDIKNRPTSRYSELSQMDTRLSIEPSQPKIIPEWGNWLDDPPKTESLSTVLPDGFSSDKDEFREQLAQEISDEIGEIEAITKEKEIICSPPLILTSDLQTESLSNDANSCFDKVRFDNIKPPQVTEERQITLREEITDIQSFYHPTTINSLVIPFTSYLETDQSAQSGETLSQASSQILARAASCFKPPKTSHVQRFKAFVSFTGPEREKPIAKHDIVDPRHVSVISSKLSTEYTSLRGVAKEVAEMEMQIPGPGEAVGRETLDTRRILQTGNVSTARSSATSNTLLDNATGNFDSDQEVARTPMPLKMRQKMAHLKSRLRISTSFRGKEKESTKILILSKGKLVDKGAAHETHLGSEEFTLPKSILTTTNDASRLVLVEDL